LFIFLHNNFILLQIYGHDTHRRGEKNYLFNKKKISYKVHGTSNLTSRPCYLLGSHVLSHCFYVILLIREIQVDSSVGSYLQITTIFSISQIIKLYTTVKKGYSGIK
jgi:hypothetical protein